MTDLVIFSPDVREAIEQFDCVTMHGDKWKLIRAELVRLAALLAAIPPDKMVLIDCLHEFLDAGLKPSDALGAKFDTAMNYHISHEAPVAFGVFNPKGILEACRTRDAAESWLKYDAARWVQPLYTKAPQQQARVTVTEEIVQEAARSICRAMLLDPDCLHLGQGRDGGVDGEIIVLGQAKQAHKSWRNKVHLARGALEAVADELARQHSDGEVVVTTTPNGRCVTVTRQDAEHRILSVIWEAKPKSQIVEEMARRFLGWRIPDSFGPDCYVGFDRERAEANNLWPIGTNIFSLDEAMKMVEHMLDSADQAAGGGK